MPCPSFIKPQRITQDFKETFSVHRIFTGLRALLLRPQFRSWIILTVCTFELCTSAFSAPLPVSKEQLHSRVLGCLVGNSIGDSFGAVIEFADSNRVQKITGKTWVDQFLPYAADHSPHPWGVWEPAAARGTGTDDTRINEVFVECVIRNQGFINPQFLAIEYIERYRDRDKFYPRHQALAEEHLSWFLARGCERLGMSQLPSGKPIEINKKPSLMGLISLAPAGLLFCGEPEKAYRKAHELDIVDVDYAVDATAIMAAMISEALGGKTSAQEMVRLGLRLDPLHYGENRPMVQSLSKFIQIADEATSDQDLIQRLAPKVKDLGVFDPRDALGVAVAALYFSDGDPVRTIVIAANNRDVDRKGNLKKLRDVDCSASIAGALVGALQGVEAFPSDWVRDTVEANKKVYDIDLEVNANRFCAVVYGREVQSVAPQDN